MTQIRVLVTGVGSTTALSVIKGLREQEVYDVCITGTDVNRRLEIAGSVFCDSFYRVPPASEEHEYVSSLQDIIEEKGIDLLVPIVDLELEVLARHREKIEPNCSLLLSSTETVEICNDKFRTFQWMAENEISTPGTLLDPSPSEIRETFGFDSPLLAKPRRGVSSRGVYEIRSEAELCLLDRIDEPIVQPKIEGTEYTIDVFAADGATSAVPRKRLETRAGISYKGRTIQNSELIAEATEIAEALDLIGPANIQCFETNSKYLFFEVNPRFSGSLTLSIEAGLNSPLHALQWAAAEQVILPDSFSEVTMCRYWEEVFHHGTEMTSKGRSDR
ncbi:ATP-grasp domain-containing protein [Salinibacter ruber]|uniref:ATP-grasp domain-containing protein n=1 Tax=Salinibacter ruber TaxID=146919 RepID=UPI002167EEE4|nr:ATP-grasp domain-containing protein [Salinibacter ruber]MCS4100844.1 carbamoyl-phosphate synthase large subunit [Salinibacter ruber]